MHPVHPGLTPSPLFAPTPSAASGLAQRLLQALSDSEFAATIGELKRQMDRQSQLFLQKQQQDHQQQQIFKAMPVGQGQDTAAPQNLLVALARATHQIADLCGGDAQAAGGDSQAKAATMGQPRSPTRSRKQHDLGDTASDCSITPCCSANPSRPELPPATVVTVTDGGAPALPGDAPPPGSESLALADASRPERPAPCVSRSGTITLSTGRHRGTIGTPTPTTPSSLAQGRAAPKPTPPSAKRTPPAPPPAPRPAAWKPPRPTAASSSRRRPPAPPLGSRPAGGPCLTPRLTPRPAPKLTPRPATGGPGPARSRPRSLASRGSGAVQRVPSQATFVKQPLEAPRQLRSPHLLQLPAPALLRLFAHLAPRERALPVCRRWVDLGLRAELWRAVDFGPRGSRDVLCRRLEFSPALERLRVADRRDVNHILNVALRRCPRLADLHLERCQGPGAVLHCGTFSPRTVTVLDTPVSNQLVDLLANVTTRMHECTVSVNVEQAAALFGSLLKMALVADGKVPEQLKSLDISLGRPGDSQDHDGDSREAGRAGTLRWRRQGLRGTMSYNRVRLCASFTSKAIVQ